MLRQGTAAIFLLWGATACAQFTPASGSPVAVGTNPRALAVGDLNGDGKPDLVTANFGGNSVTVLLGNGAGGFSAAPGGPFSTGINPQSVAIGDFNGDGKADLAIANSGGNSVTILLGTGTGRFTVAAGSPISVGSIPVFVAVGDFNGDGRADLVTSNSGDGTLTLLLGNGSGGFSTAPGSPLAAGISPQGLAVADFNADGKQDVAVVSLSVNTVTVLLGDGGGGLVAAPGSPFAVGVAPVSVAVRDLNGDGKADLLIANSGDNTVTLLLGDGSGGFTPASGSPLSVGTRPESVAVADFNGDGFPDIAAANNAASNITVLWGNSTGGFTAASGSPFGVGISPVSIVVADFNGDGRPDFATANSGDASVTASLNTQNVLTANPASLTLYAGVGQSPPSAVPVSIGSSASGTTYAVAASQPWLVATPASNATGGVTKVNLSANPTSLTPGVYAGTVRYSVANWFQAATTVTLNVANPSGTLQQSSAGPFPVGAGPQSMATADFNGDGIRDLVTGNYADNTVSVLLGNGSGGFTPAPGSPFATGASPNAIAVADVNGDGKLDIVTGNAGGNSVTVLLGDGAGGFAPAASSPFAVGREPLSIVLGDFNRDGNPDIAVANNVDKSVTILLGDGAGGFQPASGSPINLGTAPQAMTAADFDGNGTLDLAVAAFNNHVTILSGNGSGGFAVTQAFPVGSFPQFVAVADLNSDGKPDLVTANFGSNNVTVLLGNGAGGFSAASGSPFAVGMQPESLTLADVNGDGKPDVISANTGENTVTILLGSGSGGFAVAPGSPFAAGTAPYAVVAGDFNGDGIPDVAVADAIGMVSLLTGAPSVTSSALSTTAGATVAFGASVPLTLKVLQPAAGFNPPTGIATFQDGGTAIGTAAQQGSPYQFTATGLPPGTHSLTATYAGDGANLMSASNTISIVVNPAAQTITFAALANKSFGNTTITLTATASSGLPVSFASTTTGVCTTSDAMVTLVAVGTCSLQATQPGDTNFLAAAPVSQHFTVTQGSQTITFGSLPNQQIGTAPLTLTATASSGLTVSYTASPAAECTVSGATLTLLASGTCTVQAMQPGNSNYTAAPAVSQHFTIAPTGQTITFGALTDQVFGSPAVPLAATATSGLAVSFASATASVCTVSGTTATLVGAGVCTIRATQAGNTSYAAAAPVSLSFNVTQGSQTITFGSIPTKPIGSQHFTVSATASSGLSVTFVAMTVSICTVSGASVTLVSVGTCTVEAQQAGNANYAAASPVDQSFAVSPGSQTITFAPLASKAFGSAPITLSATASSSMAVVFASNTPSVCTVTGSSVTLVTVGTCTVEASQPGTANFSAATPVDQSFMVTQGSQTISFGALSSQPFGSGPVNLTATASSGLPVSFTSATSPACTVSGTAVTLVGVDACSIQASQAGSANYTAASSVTQKFSITQASQSIAFTPVPSQVYGVAPFPVTATASSGLAVSLTSGATPVCTLAGATVTVVSAGTSTLQGAQPGNTNYAAATPVSQTFTVAPASQTISFPALAGRMLGPPFTLVAAVPSGLAVSFASTTPSVCTVSGTTLTLVSVGLCTVEASQAGNTNYAAAAPVDQTFPVTAGSQTISFAPLANRPFSTTAFAVSATATSGLSVSFASTTPSVCAVSGGNVTLVSVGSCTVEATQAGNSNWPAATPVDQSFQVTQGNQTITFGPLANQPFGTPPVTVSATASSGLTVSFASSTTAVCTVSGAMVTLVAIGTCSIAALQAGNPNFALAVPVTQSFMVTQASQSINFTALSNQVFGNPLALGADASSGLPVVFTASPPSVCVVAGVNVTLTGIGTCTITAAQPGNANYSAATPVPQTFTVAQANQTIAMSVLSNQGFTTAPVPLSAVASSGLPVTLTSSTPSVCLVAGIGITLLGLGTCTISAAQPGNMNYAAATAVTQSFMVTQGSQTILFGTLADQPAGAAPFALTATATSGLAVVFASPTPAVCSIAGVTVTMLKAGVCAISASQPGNAVFAPATPVVQSFNVDAAMTIGSVLNAASYASGPLASGAYTVAFGSDLSAGVAQTPSVALPNTLAGTTVTITDSAGLTLQSLLYYVSPGQINFLVPDGLAAGPATVSVINVGAGKTSFAATVAQVSPALFAADASGKGVPAAITLEGGAQGPPVFNCTGSPVVCSPVPIDLGTPSSPVYLVLFGTGIRGRSSLASVAVSLGGINLEVDYAGAQGTFPGLDQVNVLLDRALIGRGRLLLQLTVDGVAANPVVVSIL